MIRRYIKSSLSQDFIAGVTGAVAGAPQAMGFAIIAGVSPIFGLYTAFIGTIIGAIAASSTFMTIAPTNALALVVFSTLGQFDDGSDPISRLMVLTLLVGVFQVGFGVLRLGSLTRFVSNAVMTGFITGAGLLIIMGQLDHITGVHATGSTPIGRFFDWLSKFPQSDPETTIIGVVSIIIIYTLHHTRFKSIATLVAILVTTIFVTVAGWDSVALVLDMGAIPSGIPTPTLPDPSLIPELIAAAFAMSLLASVQGAGITENIPQPDGTTANVNRDFIGQGLANLGSAFLQGLPAGGSLSRTAVNISAGARTRMANLFSGIMVGAVLVAFGAAIEQVTLAALAGHLVVAAMSLIRPQQLMVLWRINLMSRVSMLVTLSATLILPLEYSIYIGVVVSSAIYVYTSASNIKVTRLIKTDDGRFRAADVPKQLQDREIAVLSVSGHLFFAAMRHLDTLMPAVDNVKNPVVILRVRDNTYLGNTGVRFLQKYSQKLREQDGLLVVCGIDQHVMGQLQRSGMISHLGEDNIFSAGEVIFSATEEALKYVNDWLDQRPQPV